MSKLNTTYAGIKLSNPLILGASNLVDNINIIKKAIDHGISAIVYKSLFEEQIQLERLQMEEELTAYDERYYEMLDVFPNIKHAGPQEHLNNLRKFKQSVSVPVIASLNAINNETWLEYAKLIEETGIDALELNFYSIPRNIDIEDKDIIENQIFLVREIVKSVKIPVTVKLSPFYVNPLNIISKMDKEGVAGFVIFNRFFNPDINILHEKFENVFDITSRNDLRIAMRFIGLLYDNISSNLCGNTGIQKGEDVIKMILAGADCVQIVSTVYKNKPEYISTIIQDIIDWMNQKGYNSIDDFKGKLSNKKIEDPYIYKRAQYVELLLKSEELFNKKYL